MFESDFILRLVQQLTQALARILGRRAAGEEDQLEEELDEFTRTGFGMSLELLASMRDDELFQLIVRDHHADYERLALLARILYERSQSTRAACVGEPAWSRKALRILAALGESGHTEAQTEHRQAFRVLLAAHDTGAPAMSVLHDLWLGYEAVGDFARAEDKLYALVATAPEDYVDAGQAFYQRLLTRDDDTLENGGLPRDEVQEGLERWQRTHVHLSRESVDK